MKNFTVLGGKISGRSYNIYVMLWNVQKWFVIVFIEAKKGRHNDYHLISNRIQPKTKNMLSLCKLPVLLPLLHRQLLNPLSQLGISDVAEHHEAHPN